MSQTPGNDDDLVKTSDELDPQDQQQDASAQEADEQPGDDDMLPDAPDGRRPAAT